MSPNEGRCKTLYVNELTYPVKCEYIASKGHARIFFPIDILHIDILFSIKKSPNIINHNHILCTKFYTNKISVTILIEVSNYIFIFNLNFLRLTKALVSHISQIIRGNYPN